MSLYINSKRHQRQQFKLESELENIVVTNSKLLFGEKTIYIDTKKKINSGELGKTIPDGLLFDLTDIENPKFYLVEVELAKHSFYSHIFPQITKFFAFLREGNHFQSDLIDFLYKSISSDPTSLKEFRKYIGDRELFKFLKDVVENSTDILIIIDDLKPEFQEIKDTYTDTWDKYVRILTLNKYLNEKSEILQLEPDFEIIKDEISEVIVDEEIDLPPKYSEEFHLEGVKPEIKDLYFAIKNKFSAFTLNPQHYYISLKSAHNFVFLKFRKSKIKIVVMLPFEKAKSLSKELHIVEPSLSVQKFYYGKCSSFTLESSNNLEEALRIIEVASKSERIKVIRD